MKNFKQFDSLGQYLKYLRREKQLTQSQVAEIVKPGKYGWKAISKMEKGHQNVHWKDLVKFAEALSCEEKELQQAMQYFLGGEVDARDDATDLRPLLGKLGSFEGIVTEKNLFEATAHFIALSKVGGV